MKKSTSRKSPMKSPMKSPQKKSRAVNDENCSPDKQSLMSPTKKMQSPVKQNQESNNQGRKSQRRRMKDQELAESQQLPQKVEESSNTTPTEQINPESPPKSSETSPLKSCKKSPLKRMKNLEEKDNIENQENIETTYTKSQAQDDVKAEENCSDEDESADTLEPRFLQAENKIATVPLNEEPKSILGQINQCTDPMEVTETQELGKVIDINDILDVDSNVINYGQFICGKILGSTLQLSNISEQDQIVTMTLSKQKLFNCDEIFGQYNRDELPFSYKDGTEIANSEVDHQCWFIENPVSKELQKTITVKISPNTSQEFIVVIKAPKNKLTGKIVSFIDIELQDDKAPTPVEKMVNHKEERVVLKEQPIARKIDILLLGYLDNPQIKCMKQLVNQATNQ